MRSETAATMNLIEVEINVVSFNITVNQFWKYQVSILYVIS